MELVVDANVLFSAAIKDSATAALLLRDDIVCRAPDYLFEEFESYRETLLGRTYRDTEDFEQFVGILRRRIEIVPQERFADHEDHARRISPDPGDVPYLALALSLDAALWSDDRELGEQDDVPVLTTTELLDVVGS